MPLVERFRIQGGARLVGEVRVDGAKNSVLKLMAAALLAPGRTTLHAVPDILDIEYMAAVLRRLGCEVVTFRAWWRYSKPTAVLIGPAQPWNTVPVRLAVKSSIRFFACQEVLPKM